MNNLYEIIYTPKISGKPKVVTLHAKDVFSALINFKTQFRDTPNVLSIIKVGEGIPPKNNPFDNIDYSAQRYMTVSDTVDILLKDYQILEAKDEK